MDNISSAASSSSRAASTVPATDSKQPTYTTAGTIYNPSSALPLQPPTRRGRSAKWALGSSHSELSLLPKSVLVNLSSKAFVNNSSARPASTLQQYTPLQQNYDRAVSPTAELEHAAITMPLQAPRMRSGNLPAPVSIIGPDSEANKLDKGKGKLVHDEPAHFDGNIAEQDEDDDDEDDEFSMTFLQNMTVKSLNNLASYPNPTQKIAQKALLGRRPKPGGPLSAGTSASPFRPLRQQAGSSSDELNLDLGLKRMDLPRPAKADASAVRDHSHLPTRLLPTARSPSPVLSVEANAVPAPTTLGPGPPRPLTAGPPGQRQYRPSTFESTFRALQPRQQGHGVSREDAEGFAIAQHTLAQVGIEDISSFEMDALDFPDADAPSDEDEVCDITNLVKHSEPEEEAPRRPPIFTCATSMPMAVCDSSLDMSQTYWRNPSSWPSERYVPGTARLTEQAIEARNETIARDWYAGSGLMEKSYNEVLLESSRRKLQHSYYGLLGGRQGADEKADYQPIDVAEASRTPVAEHTGPLLKMAFAALVRHADQRELNVPFSQFETPAK